MEAGGSNGSRWALMEVNGGFHRKWLWKLQLVKVGGNFHFHQRQKFPRASIYFCECEKNFHDSEYSGLHGSKFIKDSDQLLSCRQSLYRVADRHHSRL